MFALSNFSKRKKCLFRHYKCHRNKGLRSAVSKKDNINFKSSLIGERCTINEVCIDKDFTDLSTIAYFESTLIDFALNNKYLHDEVIKKIRSS